MRHAFIILAHNEFQILQKLIDALDSRDVTFFIHIDKKVNNLPTLYSKESQLFFVQDRVDIRWGDVSMVYAELASLKEAFAFDKKFDFYHIISGVTFPLKSISSLNSYFEQYAGKSIFCPFYKDLKIEDSFKVRLYNINVKYLMSKNKSFKRVMQFIWTSFNYIQKKIGIRRYKSSTFYAASQWCSLSKKHVELLISHSTRIKHKYLYTFCPDEIFIPSELIAMGVKKEMVMDCNYLYLEWKDGYPKILGEEDYPLLSNSNYIFARKMSIKSLPLISMLQNSHNNK